ncbi:MAG: solute carrier family 13 (sodium-dependent dicarboxylate transporter) member 2/3/5 [Caulobacteraceae bacterium]|nr:MAG: solute carrier family 13 (sodium-dependent dicarboxylate transporter) member 2/3/5 [Caulobacteraceae bacterium]
MTTITDEADSSVEARSLAQRIGFWVGPALFALIAFAVRPTEGLPVEALRMAGLAAWVAVWWATEAIPIAATSLLPLVIIPLAGAGSEKQAAAPYANPIVMLLLGGSFTALAIERWNLHRRIALNVLARVGDRPRAMVFGFMLTTAFISMWISNTSTALMMMPIALSTAAAATSGAARDKFAAAMVLGVAYAASIGGVATPIGTPTNLIAMGWMKEELGRTVSFADWMALGVPTMLFLIPAAWLLVTWRMGLKGGADRGAAGEIRRELVDLGAMTTPEARVLWVFALVIALWVSGEFFRTNLGLTGVTDMSIVIAGAIAMMFIPAGRTAPRRPLLTWDEAKRAPWGVMLLYGGGISLAEAMERTKLAAWMGDQLGVLAGAPPVVIVLAVTALVIVLTEFMSNVATITMLLPVLGVLAKATGVDPLTMIVPAAIAASCGFMMPAGTGPNAVAYGTGKTSVAQMMRRGAGVNIAALVILTAVGLWIAPRLFG